MSEALIFASTNPQYDVRLFIELHISSILENSKLKPGENMLYTEIVSDIQNIFCTQLSFISSLKQAWFKKSKVKLNITKKRSTVTKVIWECWKVRSQKIPN